MLALVLLFSLLGLTAIAAYKDVLTYTIPNWIPLSLLIMFPFFILASGMTITTIGLHILVGVAALIIGLLLFWLRVFGAGDVKLFSVLVLWLGWADLGSFLLWIAFSGFFLAVLLIILRRIPSLADKAKEDWLKKILKKKAPAPYGIAINIAVYLVLPSSVLFQSLLT